MKQQLLTTAAYLATAQALTVEFDAPVKYSHPITLAQTNDFMDFINDIGGGFEDMGNWFAGAGEDMVDWFEGAGNSIADWTVNAGEDIGDWTVNAGEDIGNWFEGAGLDVADWFVNAAYDTQDWFEGAGNDVADWTVQASYDIAGFTVNTGEDFGELASDVWDRMGDFADVVESEINQALNEIGDWGVDTFATFESYAVSVGDEILALEDKFKEFGEFAAELYEQAESAFGDLGNELYDMGDAILKEAMMIGAEIERLYDQMENWTVGAIDSLETAMNVAGAWLEDLGEDIANSPAGQKTKIFVMGFIEECSKAGKSLYQSTIKIGNEIASEGLHNVLADGIVHFGDAATHFVTQTFLNEIGGEMSKFVTIPLTTVMKAVGLEEQGTAMKNWLDGALVSFSETIDEVMTGHFELTATLFSDPEEFGRKIAAEPWLLANYVVPMGHVVQFTFAEQQLREFFEYDVDFKIPNDWIDDL